MAGRLKEKTARQTGARFAPLRPAERHGKKKAFLRAGHPDVAEAPFFRYRRLVQIHDRTLVRQNPLFHADHVDFGKLQPFGGVIGQEHDAVLEELLFLLGIELGLAERCVDKKFVESSFRMLL